MSRRLHLLVLVSSLLAVPVHAHGGGIASLPPYVDAVMDAGVTPALQVAVVQDGRIAWGAARGFADLDASRMTDEETRFYIASTSKALLAMAALQRHVRGELPLSTTLAQRLPQVVMPEGMRAEDIDLLSLLTHTHGIGPRGPVTLRMTFSGEYTNEVILEALGAHQASPRGRAYQYSNLGYELAALMLDPEHTYGYKSVVDREVIEVLGMQRTTSMVSSIDPLEMAMPHELMAEGFARIDLAKSDANMGPAGGHFSTARDLARLILAMMDEGRIDGHPALSPEAVRLATTPQVAQDREVGFVHRTAWGIGWDLGEAEGVSIVHRHGGFSGYRSHVSFAPEHGIGVVVLVNGGDAASPVTDVLAMAIYDALLDHAEGRGRFDERLAKVVADAAAIRASVAEDLATRASRQQPLPQPLESYVGTYSDPLWGTMRIDLVDGALTMAMGVSRSAVEVYDAAKNQLRVELIGSGAVVDVHFDREGEPATALTLLGMRFERS